MGEVRKYAFDTEFAADGAVVRASKSRLSPEAVEAERTAAYERGKQDALVRAEQQVAAALEAIADVASTILARLEAESRALREDGAALAIASARKIAGAALDAFGEARALSVIEATMELLRHQPRLVLKLAPEAVESLKPRIEAMCESHAYAGAILVRAEPGLSAGAVVIDWSDGAIASDPEDIARRIDAHIETALAAPETHP